MVAPIDLITTEGLRLSTVTPVREFHFHTAPIDLITTEGLRQPDISKLTTRWHNIAPIDLITTEGLRLSTTRGLAIFPRRLAPIDLITTEGLRRDIYHPPGALLLKKCTNRPDHHGGIETLSWLALAMPLTGHQ